MAEDQTLNSVVAKLKTELNYPPTTSINNAEDCRLASLLNSTQQWLADEWDWPTLEEWWDITMSSGGRFYTFPANSDFGPTGYAWNKRRPVRAMVKFNTVWLDIEYGIDETEEYNYLDSDIGVTSDPVMRWQYNTTTKIEVWPVPASSYLLRIRGQRNLTTLGNLDANYTGVAPYCGLFTGANTLDLDDNTVVAFAAAQHLAEQGSPLAPQIFQKAQAKMMRVRAQEPRRESRIFLGGNNEGQRTKLAGVKIIAVA